MGETLEVTVKPEDQPEQPSLAEEAKKYDPAPDEEVVLPSEQGEGGEQSEDTDPDTKDDEDGQEEKTVEEQVEDAGLNFDELSAKFYENGELEDSDYEALEKAGIPRAYVDRFIELEAQAAQAQRTTILAEVGGEEGYADLSEWAKGVLTEKELAVYNKAVSSPDFVEVQTAVRGLYARYQNETGIEPARVINGKGGNDRGSVYESHAEMMRDMSDPRYRTDPAFRAKVEAKVGRSNLPY